MVSTFSVRVSPFAGASSDLGVYRDECDAMASVHPENLLCGPLHSPIHPSKALCSMARSGRARMDLDPYPRRSGVGATTACKTQ